MGNKRKIKFRAWDNNSKKMLDNVTIGTIEVFDNDKNIVVKSSYCNFMQYVGLEDKNGREIYEGDIVDFNIWGDKHFKGVVVNEYGGIFVKYKDCEDEEKGYLADIVASDDEFEVLGNIYENPNLLV